MLPGVIKSVGFADETTLFEKNYKGKLRHESKYLKRDRKKYCTLFKTLYSIWNSYLSSTIKKFFLSK